MKEITFVQDPLIEAETLTLDETKVVSVRGGFGFRIVRSIPLRDLSGDVVVTKRLDLGTCIVVFTMILLPVFAIIWLADIIPFSTELAFVLVSLFLISMTGPVVKKLRPWEVTRFLDLHGKVALEIYLPRRRVWEYIDFVNALSERIERQTHGSPGGSEHVTS